MPLTVKYKWVPSYSIAPLAGAVKFVPAVSANGALAAVPAPICNNAPGAVVPIPTFPLDKILIASLAVLKVITPLAVPVFKFKFEEPFIQPEPIFVVTMPVLFPCW